MDRFCTCTEDALCLSRYLTLNLLPFSLGGFSFVLSSFTSGRSRSEGRDTKGSVGEKQGGTIRRRPGAALGHAGRGAGESREMHSGA